MNKIAIFTEGQGELIFVRHLLTLLSAHQSLSFDCYALRQRNRFPVPYASHNPNASTHFLIVNVGNDERVVSVIKDREANLISKGYSKVVGLRDMYSETYCKRSKGIDATVNQDFIEAQAKMVQQMNHPDKIHIFFAIMELESWLLSMHNLFEKIHSKLTCQFIEERLGFNLSEVNPETSFFHPTNEFTSILGLVGVEYTKSRDQMESILSKMADNDIEDASKPGRPQSFAIFYSAVIDEGN